MAFGIYNGPLSKGECPASLAPAFRFFYNWVNPMTLVRDTSNFIVDYNFASPIFYKINPADRDPNFDEHYVIETRLRDGFDSYTPNDPSNLTTQSGTLLIWHDNVIANGQLVDYSRLIFADNLVGTDGCVGHNLDCSFLSDFFPKDALINRQSFNDITSPAAQLGISDPELSYLAYSAHFALNGIHKLTNNKTLIDTISINLAMTSSSLSATWNMVSVPHLVPDFRKTTIYSGAASFAYTHTNTGYVRKDTLENGVGYWVKYNSPSSVTYAGTPILANTVPVAQGWNMIGGLTDPVTTNTITSTPAGIILTHFWGFNASTGTYFNADPGTIDPGKAYWVKVSQDGLLTLDATATQSNPAPPSSETPPPPPSAPPPPTLLSPANGATGVSTLPTLSWNASEDATSYRVQVSASASFSPLTYDYPGLSVTSKQTGALEGNTTYYWHSTATNNFGTSAWSTTSSFTTGPAPVPAAPTLASPANFATNQSTTPTLRWNTSTLATSYRVQLSSDMGFSTFVVNDPVIGTSKYVSGLNNNTTYYWRVNAKNNGGTSGWSLTWAFTTRASASCDCCPTIAPMADVFEIIDSTWNNQNLLAQLGVPSVPMLGPPDGGAFDARFASGNYLEGIAPGLLPNDIPIIVQGATYPITLSWNIVPGSDIVYTLLTPAPMTLVDSGSVTFNDLVGGTIQLTEQQSPSAGCGRTVARAPAGENSPKPVNFALSQNAPNPFNPSTIIKYDLPEESHVRLTIYNTLGQEVATPVDAVQETGYMSVVVDARSFPSGVYFYRLDARPLNGSTESFVGIKKFVLLK
jgi:hypothetical protein